MNLGAKHLNKIRNREVPNNVFLTSPLLAKTAIDMIETNANDVWFDPFKNTGNYYNQFPTTNKVYTEILEDKDFFEFEGDVDVICSNPPYSMLNKIIKKSIELNPRVINYLIGALNLTPRRIEMMEKAGYGLSKIHMCKVGKWSGWCSFIVQFEKNKKSILSYDRVVWK